MAKLKNQSDNYTSQAVFQVTETAANTLTFEKLETGMSIYDKIGWVVSRIEYKLLAASLTNCFDTSGDNLSFGLTMTNSLTTLASENPAVLFLRTLIRKDIGTPASGAIMDTTFVSDLSTLPGGGILVLPNPLYFGVVGAGLAAAATMTCRLFFQAIDLSEADYFNLVQARQLLIST